MTTVKSPRSYVRYIIIVFVVMTAIGLIASISPKRTSGDFDVYYETSQNYLARAPLYITNLGVKEFKYLPLFALVFSPLAMIAKVPALYLWSILNIFSLYAIFYFFYRLKLISFYRLKDLLIIFCLFSLTGRYIFNNIKIGQANFLLCFLMVLAIYFEIKKKDFWAAVFLALSLMIKLFPLLFIIYFVLRRRFKIVGYTILLVVLFLLLPGIYSGFSLNLKYIQDWLVLLKSTPARMFYSVKNYSLLSFFSWIFIARHEGYILGYHKIAKVITPEVYYAWAASCLVLFGLFFYDSFFKKDKDPRIVYLDYACLFICIPLFNPLAYLNSLIFLIIPYFFILRSLFYAGLNKIWVAVISLLTVFSFISSMGYNKIFFADINQFYRALTYKILLWTMILVYLNLWLIKLALKLKFKKQALSASP